MTNTVQHCCNVGGMVVALGTIAGYIPVIAGTVLSILGCIYYGLQIWDWVQRKRAVKNLDV